jgi:outer membrane protein assembly factor BamD (BamD/ComL family)
VSSVCADYLSRLIFSFQFPLALKSRIERLGKDHESTARASRSLGITKYMNKSYGEARIYLEDFVRVMEAHQAVDDAHYILALQLLGEVNLAESRGVEAKQCWMKAKSTIDEFPAINETTPEFGELIGQRMEKANTQVQETKSLFSRFTELARFEDEVSAELPVEERLEELITSVVFMDD